MDAEGIAIAVNDSLREVAARLGVTIDPDAFGLRLSRAVARRVATGEHADDAVRQSVKGLRTSYFSANGISRAVLSNELCRYLKTAGLPEAASTTRDVILGFKAFAERQLVGPLRRDPSEENARSLLQTYMATLSRTYREVLTGAGRADIVLLDSRTHEVIETKLWDGPAYYEDGLREITEYLRTEGLRDGHYVVFDIGASSNIPQAKGSEVWEESLGQSAIHVYFVRIPRTPPSKLGRQRRADRASRRRRATPPASPSAAAPSIP